MTHAQLAARVLDRAPRPDQAHQSIQEFAARVKADLAEYLRVTKKSQATAAKAIGMSDGVISQFLSPRKSYPGDVVSVAHSINAWLMLEAGRLGLRREPMWVETKNATQIHTALELTHKWCDVGMIYGAAGSGKTRTAEQYKRTHGTTVVLIGADETLRSPYAFLGALGEELGLAAGSTVQRLAKELIAALGGSGRLLIVDEAQKLTFKAAETLRAIYDKGRGFGLMMMGDEVLWRTFTAGRSRAEYERLVSRLGIRRAINPGIDREDVEKIAVQYLGHKDPECIEYLQAKGAGVGGIRAVVKHSEHASQIALEHDRNWVTVEDLRAASARMGTDRVGGNGR
jgi:DNA transposition AAA+ family ATPase